MLAGSARTSDPARQIITLACAFLLVLAMLCITPPAMAQEVDAAASRGALVATAPPRISGAAQVGATLTATAGTWNPAATSTSTQWFVGGSAASGATGSTYTVRAADLGKVITVSVTASRTAYRSGSATSAPTAAVVAGSFASTPAPMITGTAVVGRTLTVRTSTWTPAASFAYRWQADGSTIAGATGSTYVLTPAEMGKAIRVVAVGSTPGYASRSVSSAATSIVLGALTTTPIPAISGTPRVGVALSVITGTWSPAATLTYQWLANGRPIPGARASRYTPLAVDIGKQITVAVTGARSGYAAATMTSPSTAAVLGALFKNAPTPTIVGTARFGAILTVTSGTWSPAASLTYQWLTNGTPIAGATTATYRPLASDVGKTLTVSVTGTAPGYQTTTKVSAATAAVAPAVLTATPTPAIAGVAVVGQKLTVMTGIWSPGPVTLSYQWLRSGSPIAGATAPSYVPVAADAGAKLSVAVTGAKPGYRSVAKTSVTTSAVLRVLTATPVPTITGVPRVGIPITATVGTWSPSPVALTYQWKAGGVVIAGATRSSYTPTTRDLGKTLTVTVTGDKTGYLTVSRTSAVTAKVAMPKVTHVSGTLTGATTWNTSTADIVVLDSQTRIPSGSSLTIGAGVIVKGGYGDGLLVYGSLAVRGTTSQPVVFTSLYDDSIGGDTGRDSATMSPTRFPWFGIRAYAGATFDGASLIYRYAASPVQGSYVTSYRLVDSVVEGGVDVAADGAVSIVHNSVTGHGITVFAPDAETTSRVEVSGNSVRDIDAEDYAIAVDDSALQPSLLTGNTAAGSGIRSIAIAGELGEDWTVPATGLAWTVADTNGNRPLTIPAGRTMNISPGAVLKFDGVRLIVGGALTARGSSSKPIVFTSITDDTAGGDTNGDNNTTTPAKGDWRGITFAGGAAFDASFLIYRYADRTLGAENTALFRVTDSTISGGIDLIRDDSTTRVELLRNTVTGHGIHVVTYQPSASPVAVQVSGNTVKDTGNEFAVFVHDPDLRPSLLLGNTATGTGKRTIAISGALAEDWTVPTTGLPWTISYATYYSSLEIPAGVTMTAPPGVVLKFDRVGLQVDGKLIARGTTSQPVVFTSITDDTIGGDTNGDNNTTTPTKGDWRGITFDSGAIIDATSLTVRYATKSSP